MFDKETLDKVREFEKNWKRDVMERYPGKDFLSKTDSGIGLKAHYTPVDMRELPPDEIGVPGQYPYTRGIYPIHYQFQPWVIQNLQGYDLPEQTRKRMELLSKEGMEGYFGITAYNLVWDTASKAGFDPDEPEAEGMVGYGGISLATIEDMDYLFQGMALDRISVVLNVSDMSMIALAMYIAYAQRRGIAKDKLRGNTMNYLYRGAMMDSATFLPRGAFDLMVELVRYCTRYMPRWNTTNLCGYFVEQAGGSAVQEIALPIALSIALGEKCVECGLNPDDFFPRFSFQIGQGNDFFESIAKLRSLRKVWAKVNRERFGCKNPRSLQARIHVQTSGASLTAQQPLNNIIRAAVQTLGAVLGGANSIQTCAYDEALSIPSEEAAILSLRTQQIIRHEPNVTAVSDPLGGSYYVEWLTKELEQKSLRMIEQINERGGFQKYWENGWFRRDLEEVAYHRQEELREGKEVIVGVNKYVSSVSSDGQKVPVFRHDPEAEKTAIERVKRFRARRDNARTQRSLKRLEEVAVRVKEGGSRTTPMLMEALIDAAVSDATFGEMAGTLKRVFGWGISY